MKKFESNNVLQFPVNGNIHPQTKEQLLEYFVQNKKTYINHLVAHYSTQLINKLALHGFKIDDVNFIKNFTFTVESLKSTLYQSLDMTHPLKEPIDHFISELIKIEENDTTSPDDNIA